MAKAVGSTISTKVDEITNSNEQKVKEDAQKILRETQDAYVKELAEYRESVKLRAGVYYLPAYREQPNGEGGMDKILPATYSPENDVERLKYEYFFEIVGYDKRICEQILEPKAMALRLALADYNIIDLMIKYKERELNILSTSFGVLDASDKQKNI